MMSLGLFGRWRAQKVIPDKEAQQSGFLFGGLLFLEYELGATWAMQGKLPR